MKTFKGKLKSIHRLTDSLWLPFFITCKSTFVCDKMKFLLVCDDAIKFSFIETKYSTQWQIIEHESQLMKKAKNNSQMGLKQS